MDELKRLDDKWNSRDLPVLVAAARLLEDQDFVDADIIAADLELSHRDVVLALKNLEHRHLELLNTSTYDGRDYMVRGIFPAGLEAAGQWPSPELAADRLEAALTALVDAAPEGSPQRGKFVALRDGLLAAGRDVIIDVAGSVISGRLPL